jgi:hypothetical protein
MLTPLQRIAKATRGRLSRRIVFWVFISVIVIETIILIPSFKRRENELLTQLKEISTEQLSLIMRMSSGGDSDKKLFEMLKLLRFIPQVLGGAFFRSDGTPLGVFGEPPEFMWCFFPIRRNTTGRFWRTTGIYTAPAGWKRNGLHQKHPGSSL